MGKVLLVGKGELIESVKESIGATHTDKSNLETVDYDEEWFKLTRNLKNVNEYWFIITVFIYSLILC